MSIAHTIFHAYRNSSAHYVRRFSPIEVPILYPNFLFAYHFKLFAPMHPVHWLILNMTSFIRLLTFPLLSLIFHCNWSVEEPKKSALHTPSGKIWLTSNDITKISNFVTLVRDLIYSEILNYRRRCSKLRAPAYSTLYSSENQSTLKVKPFEGGNDRNDVKRTNWRSNSSEMLNNSFLFSLH